MEDWDQEELEKAVAEKHAAEKGPNKTDIICKFFLDAVEKKLYGWYAPAILGLSLQTGPCVWQPPSRIFCTIPASL